MIGTGTEEFWGLDDVELLSHIAVLARCAATFVAEHACFRRLAASFCACFRVMKRGKAAIKKILKLIQHKLH